MGLPTRNKIISNSANCNRPTESDADKRSQSDLGLAVAQPKLLKSGLVHISDPVRRILARLASRVR